MDSGDTTTTTSSSNEEMGALLSVEALRASLAEGGAGSLLVLDTLGEHRLKRNSKKMGTVSDLVAIYPDVLKVRDDCLSIYRVCLCLYLFSNMSLHILCILIGRKC